MMYTATLLPSPKYQPHVLGSCSKEQHRFQISAAVSLLESEQIPEPDQDELPVPVVLMVAGGHAVAVPAMLGL